MGADELNQEAEPQWVTRMWLQEHVCEIYGIDMSRKRICTLAGVWDLDWGAIKMTPAGKCSPERMLLWQIYVLQLAGKERSEDAYE